MPTTATPITITMPKLNERMDSGVLCRMNVREGDTVEKGDILCEIEYNKVVTELEAEETMTILSTLAEEGDELPCGAPILTAKAGNDK